MVEPSQEPGTCSVPNPGRDRRVKPRRVVPDPIGSVRWVRFQLVPAAYVMLLRPAANGGDEVLLQLRQGTGFMDGHWACAAAGHVEAGESVLSAAIREAAEELGVTIEPHEMQPLTTVH